MVRLLRGYKIRRLDTCIADAGYAPHFFFRSPRPPKTTGVSSLGPTDAFPARFLRRAGETRTRKITYNREVATRCWSVHQQLCFLAT